MCDEHFLSCDFYYKCGRRFLKKGAVPLIFVDKAADNLDKMDVDVDFTLENSPSFHSENTNSATGTVSYLYLLFGKEE